MVAMSLVMVKAMAEKGAHDGDSALYYVILGLLHASPYVIHLLRQSSIMSMWIRSLLYEQTLEEYVCVSCMSDLLCVAGSSSCGWHASAVIDMTPFG